MSNQIIPLFGSIPELEAELKAAKESGSYADDREYYLTVEFLLSYKGSNDTFSSYRRELEKLLLWSRNVLKQPVSAITRAEIEDFIEFCQKPPAAWIGHDIVSRFTNNGGQRQPNPKWRPFINKKPSKTFALSDPAVRALFAVLNSYFGYLMQEEYVQANPVAMIRQKKRFLRTIQEAPKIRRLSDTAKRYVLNEAQAMASSNPKEHERTLFIIKAMLSMYLRISELTETERWKPKMNDFSKDSSGRWWFFTVGKGNKQGEISVSDEMLEALKRYREHLGLTPLPSPDDETPLIHKLRGSDKGVGSTRRIRMIVQECFDRAINLLTQQGNTEEAGELKHATVHWLRHTGISDDIKSGRPREHVRDDARHSSSAITDRYVDVSRADRHKSGKFKRLNNTGIR